MPSSAGLSCASTPLRYQGVSGREFFSNSQRLQNYNWNVAPRNQSVRPGHLETYPRCPCRRANRGTFLGRDLRPVPGGNAAVGRASARETRPSSGRDPRRSRPRRGQRLSPPCSPKPDWREPKTGCSATVSSSGCGTRSIRNHGEIPRTLLIAPDGLVTPIEGTADLEAVKVWLDHKPPSTRFRVGCSRIWCRTFHENRAHAYTISCGG